MANELVVVGGGLATARVVKAYREAGGEGAIRVFSADDAIPYHRPPLSKRYLRGEIEADGTYVEPEGFYEEQGAELHLATSVSRVRPGELELEGGERVPYGRLVVATGAWPRKLDLPGWDGVHELRTLADSTAIRDAAQTAKSAVCIGSGFIGLEVAASLCQLGVEVALLDRGGQLFRPLRSPDFSRYLDDLYRERGVELVFEDEPAEFTGGELRTRRGRTLPADLVVAGLGVDPSVDLLEGSGVEVSDGVVVNERFESSVTGIYAVGDVARFRDPVFGRSRRIEHWSNANYQGSELGKLLATGEGGYDTVSSFFSELFGKSVRVFGDIDEHEEQELHGSFEEGKATVLYLEGGGIAGALTMGAEDEEVERLKELILRRAEPSEYRLST